MNRWRHRFAGSRLRANTQGWVSMLLCAVLVMASMLVLSTLHRSTLQREQAWRLQWGRLQAQALGHGGLMWVLARLEDPRPVDDDCRSLSTSHSPSQEAQPFAARMARPGMRAQCVIPLGDSSSGDDARENSPSADPPWQCTCSASVDQSNPSAPGTAGASPRGVLDILFDGSETALVVRIASRIEDGAPLVARWQESVVVRRDERRQWRATVGRWWDDRLEAP